MEVQGKNSSDNALLSGREREITKDFLISANKIISYRYSVPVTSKS
jgi:hypothetical protein